MVSDTTGNWGSCCHSFMQHVRSRAVDQTMACCTLAGLGMVIPMACLGIPLVKQEPWKSENRPKNETF